MTPAKELRVYRRPYNIGGAVMTVPTVTMPVNMEEPYPHPNDGPRQQNITNLRGEFVIVTTPVTGHGPYVNLSPRETNPLTDPPHNVAEYRGAWVYEWPGQGDAMTLLGTLT